MKNIRSEGFGIAPKIVMCDEDLSYGAKAVYCYLSAFAGRGNRAFPTREKVLRQLKMSKNTYVKYIKELIEKKYITRVGKEYENQKDEFYINENVDESGSNFDSQILTHNVERVKY